MTKERLEEIRENIERVIALGNATGLGVHSSDKLKIELYNYVIELEDIIDKAIKYNRQIIEDVNNFYRPTSDMIYSGDSIIENAESNISILQDK